MNGPDHPEPPAGIRVDRWLWAARAFKSRSLAAQACDGGKVTVNGTSPKPPKMIRPGDLIVLTHPGGERRWRVVALADRRGPAPLARALYEDLSPPPSPRPTAAPPVGYREPGSGRPTKRDRRRQDRLRDW
jgi:ribosome-associated heat shock protein Hsp15